MIKEVLSYTFDMIDNIFSNATKENIYNDIIDKVFQKLATPEQSIDEEVLAESQMHTDNMVQEKVTNIENEEESSL